MKIEFLVIFFYIGKCIQNSISSKKINFERFVTFLMKNMFFAHSETRAKGTAKSNFSERLEQVIAGQFAENERSHDRQKGRCTVNELYCDGILRMLADDQIRDRLHKNQVRINYKLDSHKEMACP